MLEVVAREVAYQLVIHSGNQKINSQRDIRHFVKKVPILTPKNGNFSKISSVTPLFYGGYPLGSTNESRMQNFSQIVRIVFEIAKNMGDFGLVSNWVTSGGDPYPTLKIFSWA